jgi:hypothetical protein
LVAVSEPLRPDTVAAEPEDDVEVVDALPVPEGPGEVPAPTPAAPPRGALVTAGPVAVQAAAVAVTGFAAGAATVAVVRRHRAKKARRSARRRGKDAKGLGEIRASRSFLVDIHLLNRD